MIFRVFSTVQKNTKPDTITKTTFFNMSIKYYHEPGGLLTAQQEKIQSNFWLFIEV